MSDPSNSRQIFEEKYEILSILGAGGLGTVYKARQLDLNRLVALKVVHLYISQDPEFKTRFLREAQALNHLQHSNIVCIYHLGVASTGQLYISMELVEGKSGRQLLIELNRLPSLRSLAIVHDAARALFYVHQNGMVHRDLKPENLILTEANTVKLIDFGLARMANSEKQQLTQTGELIGTATYMSPEQCKGLKADERSDIYGLGACLYELLSGSKCYDADNPIGVLYKHLNDPPPVITASMVDQFSPSLNNLIGKSMAKDPLHRFNNMAEFAEAIDTVMSELEEIPQQRNKFVPLAITVAIAVAGITTLSGLYTIWKRNLPAPRQAKHAINKFALSRELEPPALVHIPTHELELSRLADKYQDSMGRDATTAILKRWETMHEKTAPVEDRLAVYTRLVENYATLGQVLEAQKYAEKVFKSPFARHYSALTACHLSEMYSRLNQPKEGIAILERIIRKYPELQNEDLGMSMLYNQARCYKSMHDYKRATDILWQMEKHNSTKRDAPEASDNSARHALINILCLQGKNDLLPELIRECELAAQKQVRNPDDRAHDYYDRATAFSDGGNQTECIKCIEKARAIYEQIGNSAGVANCIHQLGIALMATGQYAKAYAVFKELLPKLEPSLRRAQILLQMADCANRLNDRSAIQGYIQESLNYYEEQVKNEQGDFSSMPDTIYTVVVSRMSDVLCREGKPSVAEKLVARWIEKIESKSKVNEVLVNLYGVKFTLCLAQHQKKEALQCLDKQIEIISQPEFAEISKRHGIKEGKYFTCIYASKSEVLLSEPLTPPLLASAIAAAKNSRTYLNGDPGLSIEEQISVFLRLGRVFYICSRTIDSSECYERASALIRQLEIAGDKTTDWLMQLAISRLNNSSFKEAEKVFRECQSALHKQKEDESETMLRCLAGLGNSLHAQHKYTEANNILKKAASLSEKLQKRDAWYSSLMQSLAASCCAIKDYESAEKYDKDIIATCKPEDLRNAFFTLAHVYSLDKKPAECMATIEQGLQRTKSSAKSAAADQSFLRRYLAQQYFNAKDFKEAEIQYKKSLESAISIEGNELERNTELASSYEDVANLFLRQGQKEEASKYFQKAATTSEKLGDGGVARLKHVLSRWLAASQAAHNAPDIASAREWLQKLKQKRQ